MMAADGDRLRQQLRVLIGDGRRITIAAVARNAAVELGALASWLAGQYRGAPELLEARVRGWLDWRAAFKAAAARGDSRAREELRGANAEPRGSDQCLRMRNLA